MVNINTGVNAYRFSKDGLHGYGTVPTGEIFIFDKADFNKIKNTSWYRCNRSGDYIKYIGNRHGVCIHRYIIKAPSGYEIDHINHNPLDNRKQNLRICTHQQNQFNQPPQKNNSSGVTGVSYYAPRNKYRARIKYNQNDLHLGYYETFLEAVQARNEGMRLLFGEYGFYTPAPDTPDNIKNIVIEKCSRFIKEASFSFKGASNE